MVYSLFLWVHLGQFGLKFSSCSLISLLGKFRTKSVYSLCVVTPMLVALVFTTSNPFLILNWGKPQYIKASHYIIFFKNKGNKIQWCLLFFCCYFAWSCNSTKLSNSKKDKKTSSSHWTKRMQDQNAAWPTDVQLSWFSFPEARKFLQNQLGLLNHYSLRKE